jgi:hypothetical protein
LKKNLPHGFDKSADLLSKRQDHEEDFFSSYDFTSASQKILTLSRQLPDENLMRSYFCLF